nr:cytochrome P450 4C1-like [Cherax quadricarinatus]
MGFGRVKGRLAMKDSQKEKQEIGNIVKHIGEEDMTEIARVQEELDGIFDSADSPVTWEDVHQLKYTEMCIKEALRIFPPAPFISRKLEEDVVIENYRVPSGTTVQLVIYKIHRDPAQFPDPEVFDPDRFLPENVNKRHPYAYIPFSAGPRNCIGKIYASER